MPFRIYVVACFGCLSYALHVAFQSVEIIRRTYVNGQPRTIVRMHVFCGKTAVVEAVNNVGDYTAETPAIAFVDDCEKFAALRPSPRAVGLASQIDVVSALMRTALQ